MRERRRQRSELRHRALNLLLDAARERAGANALALTTHDGLLVAGVGDVDVEWMGALGAASRRARFPWDGQQLFVRSIAMDDVELCLTSAGTPVADSGLEAGVHRILGT